MRLEMCKYSGAGVSPLLLIILVGFAAKTVMLAFWFVPLADVSDEPGHYSYVLDIAKGRGIPVIGKAPMDQDVRQVWLKGNWLQNSYTENYIAQHPPLYYAVNAVVVKAAMVVVEDPVLLWKSARLVSILAGTLALWFLYKGLLIGTSDERFALFGTAFLSFVPMYSWQSAGVSNDMFLVLMSTLASYFWLRFLKTQTMKYGILMAIFLSLSVITKLTALLILVPMVASTFFVFDGTRATQRMSRVLTFALISMALPLGWMTRSYVHYGSIFATWQSVMDPLPEGWVASIGLLEYLTTTTAIQSIFYSFFGHFGWAGSGEMIHRVFLIQSVHFMLLYFLICSWFVATSILMLDRWERKFGRTRIAPASVLALLLGGVLLFSGIPVMEQWTASVVLYATMIGMAAYAVRLIPASIADFRAGSNRAGTPAFRFEMLTFEQRAVYWSLAICVFFSFVFVLELRDLFARYDILYGVNGRYWFPLMALLLLALVYPGYRFVRLSGWILASMTLLMALNELLIYLYFAFPGLSS